MTNIQLTIHQNHSSHYLLYYRFLIFYQFNIDIDDILYNILANLDLEIFFHLLAYFQYIL